MESSRCFNSGHVLTPRGPPAPPCGRIPACSVMIVYKNKYEKAATLQWPWNYPDSNWTCVSIWHVPEIAPKNLEALGLVSGKTEGGEAPWEPPAAPHISESAYMPLIR